MSAAIGSNPNYEIINLSEHKSVQIQQNCHLVTCENRIFNKDDLVARTKCCRQLFHEACISNLTECPIAICKKTFDHSFAPYTGPNDDAMTLLDRTRGGLFASPAASTASAASVVDERPAPLVVPAAADPLQRSTSDDKQTTSTSPCMVIIPIIMVLAALVIGFALHKR